MRDYPLFLILLGTCHFVFAQQITTDSTLPLEALIQENLGQGCVEIKNISTTENGKATGIDSYGSFDRASSNFPFQSGIVLSTGKVSSVGNVENKSTLSDGDKTWKGDPDLEKALGISNTYNATSVEFDFTTVANQIEFNYLFASEEYFGANPCTISEGFAFLIRQAGSSTYTNIALVPGTKTPITTNTIHDQITKNQTEEICPASNPDYFEAYNTGDTNLNGRTKVLTAFAKIKPNVKYHIKLVIADTDDEFFDSAVFIESNSFRPSVDLGPPVVTCAEDYLLDADLSNDKATYKWFKDGALIAGATNPTLKVTSSGYYLVEISISLNATPCIIQDDVLVTLNTEEDYDPISDYALCDDASNDGVASFALNTKESEILSLLPPTNYKISYHLSKTEANNGDNPLKSPYENKTSPQEIFVRVKNIESDCIAITSFNLVVNPLPVLKPPKEIIVCDDGLQDGKTNIDLEAVTKELTGGNSDLSASYHFSPEDAASGDNPIALPYTNINPKETLFIRVYNKLTGCFSTTSVDITVQSNPIVTSQSAPYINACQPEDTETYSFDLYAAIEEILKTVAIKNITFYAQLSDAETGSNPIANPSTYENTKPAVQTLYIRVDDENSDCYTIVPLILHINITLTGFSTVPYYLCDDASEDGIEFADLEQVEKELKNGYDDFKIEFYESEADLTSSKNPLDKTIPFEVNQSKTLYVSVIDDECETSTTVILEVVPSVDIQNLAEVDYCSEDIEAATAIDLSNFDTQVTSGVNNAKVAYYLTEIDATKPENKLPPIYNSIPNARQETIWVRVSNSVTGCFDIAPLTINISSPKVKIPSDLIMCDDDQDEIYTIDLKSKFLEDNDPNGINFTFYTDNDDAITGSNPIATPENYESTSQNIYVRVVDNTTALGCFTIVSFRVYINTLPVFTEISEFANCEGDGNEKADFFFNQKDAEILNGQKGKDVLYFETSEDAEHRTNSIDKDLAYQNKSTPQTIYVRVESNNDENCYGTSSFVLKVGALPIYNEPSGEFLCDDSSNDGVKTYNLNEKITEIQKNSPQDLAITFHESLMDAENNVNSLPLNYTNKNNPQNIFARIDDGTYCKAIASFAITILPVPTVSANADVIEQCDSNYDGFVSFDISQIEVKISDVRQTNITTTYHESMEGVENNNEIIPDIKNYTNTSNPQTVYIKINNTISNCFVSLPINLSVNLPPAINDFKTYDICENETNSFDLTTINSVVSDMNSGLSFSYFLSQKDADDNGTPIDTEYTYISNRDTLFVRIENIEGCSTIYKFNLIINPFPKAKAPRDLESCDDDFDGYFDFDLESTIPEILGSQNPNTYEVTFYASAENANLGRNELPETYESASEESIFVRVENTNTGCFSTTQFKTFIFPNPQVEIPDQVICLDNLPLLVSANTNIAGDTYLWSTNQTTPEIEINEIGSYSVTITSDLGCVATSEFNVTESEAANIEVAETVDFSDPNNITITISGIGNYLYQLDNDLPQESNVFENVGLGYHIVTVIDLNGCAEVTKEVVVIDTPKFMTPNGDGYFDTWHITGVETLTGTIVYIFDRYGKLLTTLTHNGPGWDGRYNGHLMPATDYWFLAKVKKGDISFDVKGHFSLRL